jgi:CRISPR-associated endonuclease/helicase Cas3
MDKREKYIAHYRNSDKQEQTVKEHLEGVAEICRNLTGKLGLSDVGELLGLLHDLGKYGDLFYVYILSATGIIQPGSENYVEWKSLVGKIDHSTAGAQWFWKYFSSKNDQIRLVGQILALCLVSHHGGLIDCLDPNGKKTFFKRMDKDDEKTFLQECENKLDEDLKKRIDKLFTPELTKELLNQVKKLRFSKNGEQLSKTITFFNIGFWTRLIFSCLIDADRIDTADFESPENKKYRNETQVDWSVPINRLENKLAGFKGEEELNQIRKEISDQCLKKSSGDTGIYSLTVPTGGGKTYSSMRYALNHAKMNNMDRIIYIIPYTSIIEQNADEIRKVLEQKGDSFPWILEHHSNLEPEVQDDHRYKIITENWDAPIIFTTMVQFLEVLFRGGTRGVRRLHQLANSVLIFDEIQTLPINCVHLFCNAINFLTTHTHTTALLCTATQPLLDKLKTPEKGELQIPKENEIIHDVDLLFNQLKRVDICNKVKTGGWKKDEIVDLAISEVMQKTSCLIIVNTKKWAQQLYESAIQEMDENKVFHLSTSLCPAHRKVILDTVRQRLDDKMPVLCISTQLIEAGVDIDFASVIRFLAGFDSIAQAAGRCNREGTLDQATTYVINPAEEKIDMLPDIKMGRDVSERILREKKPENLLNPDVMQSYFDYYFYDRADEMDFPLDHKDAVKGDTLLNMLSHNPLNIGRNEKTVMMQQSFKTAGNIFKAIDAPTESVIVQYGDGKNIITELAASFEPSKAVKLLKVAQKFSVNVFPNVWKKLQEKGAVTPVQEEEGIYYLDERFYSKDFGLSVEEVSDMEFQCV